jgi:hypothetical protein
MTARSPYTAHLLALAVLACDGTAGQPAPPDGAAMADAGATADASPPDLAGGAGTLSAGVEVIDFGCVAPDQAIAYGLPIQNQGRERVGPLSASLSSVPGVMLVTITDGCSGQYLAPGERCELRLFFLAPAPITVEAILTVAGPPGPPLTLPIRAQVSPVAEKIPDSASQPLDFGNVKVGTSKSIAVVLINIGEDMAMAPRASLARAQSFTIVEDLCTGRSLPALGRCTVTVTFTPGRTGWHSDVLRLGSGEACGPIPPVTLDGYAEP